MNDYKISKKDNIELNDKKKSEYDCLIKKIGERIQQRRKKCKINQSDLAAAVGCNTESISNIENGKCPQVSYGKLWNISKALNCSVLYILGGIEQTTDTAYKINQHIGLSENCTNVLHELLKNQIVIHKCYEGQPQIPPVINMINSFFDGKIDMAAADFFENFQRYLNACQRHNEFIKKINNLTPKTMSDEDVLKTLNDINGEDNLLEYAAFALNNSYNKLLQRFDEEGIGNNNSAFKRYESKKRTLKKQLVDIMEKQGKEI